MPVGGRNAALRRAAKPSVKHLRENEAMTLGQRKLIEKTFGVIGHLSLIVAAGLILYGVGWTMVNEKDYMSFFKALLSIDDSGIIFYPSIVLAIVAFWLRAFLRAGSNSDDGAGNNA